MIPLSQFNESFSRSLVLTEVGFFLWDQFQYRGSTDNTDFGHGKYRVKWNHVNQELFLY